MEMDLRAEIRELMASGVLPRNPPVITRAGERTHQQAVCAICAESNPTVSYFWTDGRTVTLHAACDGLWQLEKNTAGKR